MSVRARPMSTTSTPCAGDALGERARPASGDDVAHVVADDDRTGLGRLRAQQPGQRRADARGRATSSSCSPTTPRTSYALITADRSSRGTSCAAVAVLPGVSVTAKDPIGGPDRPDRRPSVTQPSASCQQVATTLTAQSSGALGSTRRWPRRPGAFTGGSSTCRSARPASRTASASAVRSSHAVLRRGELALEPHDLPPARCGEPVGVLVAQVVGVRLGLGGERADDGGGVGVDVGERGHRELGAPGSRTPPHAQHVRDDSAWTARRPVRRAQTARRGAPADRRRTVRRPCTSDGPSRRRCGPYDSGADHRPSRHARAARPADGTGAAGGCGGCSTRRRCRRRRPGRSGSTRWCWRRSSRSSSGGAPS